MLSKNKLTAALLSSAVLVQPSAFAEITGTDILNILVEENIISEEKAKALAEKVRVRSSRQKSEQERTAESRDQGPSTRIQYVPEFVKSTIKESVKNEVIVEIEDNVAKKAKEEGWVVNQSPSWVKNLKISGDMRIRYQQDIFPSGNGTGIFNYNVVNANESEDNTEDRNLFYNTIEDRERLRTRARLQVVGKPSNNVNIGFRLVTGNADDPVSANQTLGTYNQKWDANFDLAYLELKDPGEKYRIIGGRFKNPWVSSGLIWDNDVTFQGVAASYSPRRLRASLYVRSLYNPFITIGAFPIQEISQTPLAGDVFGTPNDKWLYALQLGNDFRFSLANSFSFALAYYHFDNVRGKRNNLGQDTTNDTAPSYFQFGNSVFDIANATGEDKDIYALASEYELLNLNLKYTFSGMLQHDFSVLGDWVVNTAFDREEVSQLTSSNLPDRDEGYQIGFEFGTKEMIAWGDWKTSFTYRNLEGDAVIDAFADSDFLLGGTNARGYILASDFALSKAVKLSLKWLTANEIDAANQINIDVDRFQFDFNAKF